MAVTKNDRGTPESVSTKVSFAVASLLYGVKRCEVFQLSKVLPDLSPSAKAFQSAERKGRQGRC